MQHLARVASHSFDTGMTAKNIAIVWAPNLLRSKDLDMGGVAALQVNILLFFPFVDLSYYIYFSINYSGINLFRLQSFIRISVVYLPE